LLIKQLCIKLCNWYKILYSAEFVRRINVIGTDANTSGVRGGGYKVYLTQMSSEDYTAPPTHTMQHALPMLGKATSSIYIRRTNGSTCMRDGSQVPLIGPE